MKNHLLKLLLFLTFNGFSQRAPTQFLEFSSPIENLKVNEENGLVYVKEDTKISAYSNELKKIVWTVDEQQIGAKSALKKVLDFDPGAIGQDKDPFQIVPNSNYIFSNINNRDLVINGLTGEVLFNSEKDLGKEIIVQQLFLPNENGFVFLIRNVKNYEIKFFDLTERKTLWQTPVGSDDYSLKNLMSKDAVYRQDRAESYKDNFYALINNKLFSLDKYNGTIKWVMPGISRFFICQNNKNILIVKNTGGILGSKKLINILDNKNGKALWDDDIETKAIITIEDWNDKILLAHNKGFNMFDLATGKKTWRKDVKGKGFKKVLPIGTDFLFVADKEMMLINKDAEEKWKKDIEISDDDEDNIYYLDKTKSGKIMYITATYGNMVNYETGKKLWKRNIKFNEKRPLLYAYDAEKDIFLIYNDEELYKFDPNIDDKPEPLAKINVKSDKTMSGIELFDWGIALTSQSEVVGIGNDGKLLFQKEYTQPGEAGRKLLKGVMGAGVAYFGIRGSARAGLANAEYNYSYRDEKGINHTESGYLLDEKSREKLNNKAAVDLVASATINMLKQNFNKRFNALKQNSEYVYIFAKDESSNNEALKVLVKVRKKDGKEIDKIIVDDNKPLYDIDPATETIFYGKNKTLQIFE